jgi:hypothetical protein
VSNTYWYLNIAMSRQNRVYFRILLQAGTSLRACLRLLDVSVAYDKDPTKKQVCVQVNPNHGVRLQYWQVGSS